MFVDQYRELYDLASKLLREFNADTAAAAFAAASIEEFQARLELYQAHKPFRDLPKAKKY